MPLRSTGCLTCRKRKIRCDEARPGCQRCATHGVPCPGYRAEKRGGIEFEDQTNWIVRKANAGQRSPAQQQSRTSSAAYATSRTPTDSSDSSESPDNSAGFVINSTYQQPFAPHWDQDTALTWLGTGSGATAPFSMTIDINPMYSLLRSPAAERVQMYESFLNNYLPSDDGSAGNPGLLNLHLSFMRTLVTLPQRHAALSDGLDALSLVQVGSQSQDRRLLQQAVRAYSKSLTGLSIAIADKRNVSDDYVLAAASVLSACEFYDEIKQNGLGWIGHQQGVSQLLAARGPASVQSDLALLLFFNARHGAMAHALITRKATMFAQPKWRASGFRVPVQDDSTRFYDIVVQIPGLLERHDKIDLSSSEYARQLLEPLLAECERIEFDLRNWMAGWETKNSSNGGKLYELRNIDNYEVFTRAVSNPLLEQAYHFQAFPHCYLYVQYWQCMHYLRECIGSLHNKFLELDRNWQPSDPESSVTVDELTELAMNICRCFPYFCEPQASISGHVSIFLPIRVAAFHFRKHNMWQWAHWVWDVRDSVFTKGVSQPNVGVHIPPTFVLKKAVMESAGVDRETINEVLVASAVKDLANVDLSIGTYLHFLPSSNRSSSSPDSGSNTFGSSPSSDPYVPVGFS